MNINLRIGWNVIIIEFVILLLLIIYLLHQKRAIKLQKRFDAFTLKSVVDEEKSIFEWKVFSEILYG